MRKKVQLKKINKTVFSEEKERERVRKFILKLFTHENFSRDRHTAKQIAAERKIEK